MEEYFETVFLKPPCQCPICTDEAPETSDRKKYGCLYKDNEPYIANLFRNYKLFVLEGNTSLIDLPYEYYQVASYHSYYVNKREYNNYKKRKEEEVAKDIISRYAPKA